MSPHLRLAGAALPLAALLLAVSACALEAGPLAARDSLPPVRGLSWRPAPYPRCRAYVLTEAGVDVAAIQVDDHFDRFIFSDALGVMANVDEHQSIGGSLDLTLALGQFSLVPTLRYRRWLGKGGSLDLAAGWSPASGRGIGGPIVRARYAPVAMLGVEAGVARYLNEDPYGWWGPNGSARTDPVRWHAFGGVSLGGPLGAGAWGVQVLGLSLVAMALMGMAD